MKRNFILFFITISIILVSITVLIYGDFNELSSIIVFAILFFILSSLPCAIIYLYDFYENKDEVEAQRNFLYNAPYYIQIPIFIICAPYYAFKYIVHEINKKS